MQYRCYADGLYRRGRRGSVESDDRYESQKSPEMLPRVVNVMKQQRTGGLSTGEPTDLCSTSRTMVREGSLAVAVWASKVGAKPAHGLEVPQSRGINRVSELT